MEDRLRILLCEDDENLGMLLREYLQAKGLNADLFPDGESGYKAFWYFAGTISKYGRRKCKTISGMGKIFYWNNGLV